LSKIFALNKPENWKYTLVFWEIDSCFKKAIIPGEKKFKINWLKPD
jgi:hypothetical protein